MDQLRVGRTEFSIERPGNDFSGMSFRDLFMIGQERQRSFFNGVDFENCGFGSSDLRNSEFSESSFSNCEFLNCQLNSADFVDSIFENCKFENCTFGTGEWRRSRFRSCRFLQCDFDHTTIALTEFYSNEFSEDSTRSLQRRSIYFNVFSDCLFAGTFQDDAFVSRNFGVPAGASSSLPVAEGALFSLEQLCILNNRGVLRVTDLVDLIEATLRQFDSVGRRRTSTFEFIRLIVRAISLQRRISPSSLVFIENFVTAFAARVNDSEIFHSAMAFVVEIRSLLFEIATKEIGADDPSFKGVVERITISFKERFSKEEAGVLVKDLSVVAHLSANQFEIDRFKNGSTLIEVVTGGVVSLGPLLVAVNFILRQATVTVERYGKLKKAIKTAGSSGSRTVPAVRKTTSRSVATKVSTVVMGSKQIPELEATRTVVRNSGRKLIEFDTGCDIRVVTQ